MRIGYARVSTEDQNLDLQVRALSEAGCAIIHRDRASGAAPDRVGLRRAIRQCGDGDVLVAWKLDRLGRSLVDLVRLAEQLKARGAGLKILTGQGASIDTSRPEGRMIFAIFAALAEFERELIRERTKAGMAAARRRGVHLGRPRKLSAKDIRDARRQLSAGALTFSELASRFGVDPSTLRRSLDAST